MLRERDFLLQGIKDNLLKAHERMKNNADKHRRELEFVQGDKVFLKLRPYMQQSVAKRLYQKLVVGYYGPFEVLEKIGAVAYRLKLPAESKIHHVFHVSQFKPVLGGNHLVSTLPQSFSVQNELIIEPEEVLDTRYDSAGHLEALVSWTGLPEQRCWERIYVRRRKLSWTVLNQSEAKLRLMKAELDGVKKEGSSFIYLFSFTVESFIQK
ncbi:unnamed protein product [Microthlaspi erraticum]|uniref:Chromo domain-containing protein n=1 Tax=Microthlaspi erraticum TaxID=1685480 RepID=A0A6D2JST0_9BRAS|nr:unnamed protein product [Microthlaspi erraticum]